MAKNIYPSCLDRSKTDKANDRAGLKQYLVNMTGEGQRIGCTVSLCIDHWANFPLPLRICRVIG